MQSVRSGQPVPVAAAVPTARQLVARRLEAARVLAGRPSLQALAEQTGMSYTHLVGIVRGREPLLPSDERDLGAALGVPSKWLREGW